MRVLVDHPAGVDLELITELSRAISVAFDDAEVIAGAYTLEVSSPGLERPLRTAEHFSGAIGETITVRLTTKVDGARRVKGTLSGIRRRAPDRRARRRQSAAHLRPRDGAEGSHHLRLGAGRKARLPASLVHQSPKGHHMSTEMMEALQALAEDKGISVDTLFAALADALESAYKRMPEAYEYAWVTIDPDTFDIRVFAQELDEDGEPFGPEFDVTPDDFGRIAAQTAKQVMTQRIREAERELKYEEYAGREGDIVTGIIQQTDSRYTLLDLGRVEALLPAGRAGALRAARRRTRASRPTSSRSARRPRVRRSSSAATHPGLILRLFELEVPEIADGIVEIKACAREPGHRTKIAVWSNDSNVDPVGACVGARGARVRHGRQRAARREDRHRPVHRGPRRVRDEGAVAGQGERGASRRRDRNGRGHRARLPAVAGHRQGRARTPAWPPASPAGASTSRARPRSPKRRPTPSEDWAEGEWIIDEETGEQMWQPADGSDPIPASAVGRRAARARRGSELPPTARRPLEASAKVDEVESEADGGRMPTRPRPPTRLHPRPTRLYPTRPRRTETSADEGTDD